MGGPLDHSLLRQVEELIEHDDMAEAQRVLGSLGDRREFADGVAYLSTRILYARGRLDLTGVTDRLQDLLSRSPRFPEAAAFLSRALAGMLPPPTAVSAAPSAPTAAPGRMSSAPNAASPPPRPPSGPQAGHSTAPMGSQVHPVISAPPTVRASPRAPGPKREADNHFPTEPLGHSHSSPERMPPGDTESDIKPEVRSRQFSPISGLEPFTSPEATTSRPPDPARSKIPDIPRAPALPQFRDNSSPPSYAPHGAEPEYRPPKSLLPRNAGRYSEAPSAADIVGPRRARASHPPPSNPPVSDRRGRETVRGTPHRIRSGIPPRDSTNLPTLFEIASWIDEGRHRDAIAAVNRAGPDAGLEYAVLRARALAGAGYMDQALDALEKIEAAPRLDPELRAACARLYVELGDPSHALRLARAAVEGAPDRPLVRLTYALAAVRLARRKPDEALLEEADRAIELLRGREGPLPALLQALKACVQAGSGDPERAIGLAQRALGLDPKSPDALAAVAEASARLGRVVDARHAWERLSTVAPEEADAVAPLLARAGVSIAGHGTTADVSHHAGFWEPAEIEIGAGRRTGAIAVVEQAAHDIVRRIIRPASQSGLTGIASVAASFLTSTQVLSTFAPYDMSLWSIERLDAALDVLYGGDLRPRVRTDEAGLVLLLGAYLGESLRLAHGGHWNGKVSELDSARLIAGERTSYPFRILSARVHQGRRAKLADTLGDALSKHHFPPWRTRIPNPVAPPSPWGPTTWPKPSQIAALGRSVSKSPIGRYCEELAEGPLDNTTSSLIALDTYLDLIAPRDAASDPDAAWTRRISVLVGGYLGETIRELVGGEWIYGVDTATDAHAFKLELKGTVEAMPVAHVLERVIGERSSTMVDYAKTLVRRAGR